MTVPNRSEHTTENVYNLLERSFHHTPLLKAHKVLPRSRPDAHAIYSGAEPVKPVTLSEDANATQYGAEDDTPLASPGSINDSGLPPTPPSNAHDNAQRPEFSPPPFADGVMSSLLSKKPSVSTPINQRSPPTPDPSPPRTTESLTAITPQPSRPMPLQYPSSRADSFKTAREEQWSEDGADSRMQSPMSNSPTVGRVGSPKTMKFDERLEDIRQVGLGVRSLDHDSDATPTERDPSGKRMKNGVQNEEPIDNGYENIPDREWDTNLMRNVTVRRKRQQRPRTQSEPQPVENGQPSQHSTPKKVSSVRERANLTEQSPETLSMDKFAQAIGWPDQVNSLLHSHLRDGNSKRLSGASATSTVVEAVVIVTPPQRHRTLRHTGKNLALRPEGGSPVDRTPPTRSNRTSLNSDDMPLHRLVHKRQKIPDLRHRSSDGSAVTSTPSTRSSQRRETISVMVIPNQTDNIVPDSGSPTESHAKAHSVSHAKNIKPDSPLAVDQGYFDVPRRRNPASGADSPRRHTRELLDKVTAAPLPASSLRPLAPALSLVTNNDRRIASSPATLSPLRHEVAKQEHTEPAKPEAAEVVQEKALDLPPAVRIPTIEEVQPSPVTPVEHSVSPERNASYDRSTLSPVGPRRHSVDRGSTEEHRIGFDTFGLHPDYQHRRVSFDQSTVGTDEHATARHTYGQSTPFSQFSEPLEVSEATAVSIYPHTNESILEIQHVTRANSVPRQRAKSDPVRLPEPVQPTVTVEPSTPPQQFADSAQVDSPLKNPRTAPVPPAFKIIPPTPAEELEPEFPGPPEDSQRPTRRLSLVQRARRYSDTYIAPLFARPPSQVRRSVTNPTSVHQAPSVAEQGGNLHPFWRPRGFWDDFEDSEDEDDDFEGGPGRLPKGGDTSEVSRLPKLPVTVGRRLTNGFKGSGGFLIGNSLGVERHPTNSRRHYVSLPLPINTHKPPSPRVQKRASNGSLLNGSLSRGSDSERKNRWKKMHTIPGLGMQVQYIGLRGLADRIREQRAEKRRERLRKSIGHRFLVENSRMV